MNRSALSKIIALITTCIILVTLLTGCGTPATQPDVSYAGPMLDNVLTGIKDKDYAEFAKDFSSKMKSALTEAKFDSLVALLAEKIGDYESKTLSGATVAKDNGKSYTVVVYKAKYTKESGDVLITITFGDENGQKVVEGLLFNSPNLQKQ